MSTLKTKSLKKSYDSTMRDMRETLTVSEAVHSQVIHTPVLEPIVTIVANTLLRPRSLIIGGIIAGLVLIASYLISYLYGYVLSGLEPYIGFAIGWLAGVIDDSARHLASRRRP